VFIRSQTSSLYACQPTFARKTAAHLSHSTVTVDLISKAPPPDLPLLIRHSAGHESGLLNGGVGGTAKTLSMWGYAPAPRRYFGGLSRDCGIDPATTMVRSAPMSEPLGFAALAVIALAALALAAALGVKFGGDIALRTRLSTVESFPLFVIERVDKLERDMAAWLDHLETLEDSLETKRKRIAASASKIKATEARAEEAPMTAAEQRAAITRSMRAVR